MTQGFADLVVGDVVELKGPIGHFIWQGNGVASVNGTSRCVRDIGMVCGGSGITPILQVLRGILHDAPNSDTNVWVLNSNRDIDDILCREELDQLAQDHNLRFRLHYTLTGPTPPDGWSYSKGRINDDMLLEHLPEPSEDRMICICGPTFLEQATKRESFIVSYLYTELVESVIHTCVQRLLLEWGGIQSHRSCYFDCGDVMFVQFL